MMQRTVQREKGKNNNNNNNNREIFAALVAGNVACYHCKDDGC